MTPHRREFYYSLFDRLEVDYTCSTCGTILKEMQCLYCTRAKLRQAQSLQRLKERKQQEAEQRKLDNQTTMED